MEAAMDTVTYQFMLSELKVVRAESTGDTRSEPKIIDALTDSSIVGNSDKMLFLTKELVASIEDPSMTQNPLVMTKLDLDTVSDFNFDAHQKKETINKQKVVEKTDSRLDTSERERWFLGSAAEGEQDMDELYKKGFGLGADDEEEEENDGSLAKKAMELLEHDKQRYAPKLKQKKFRANIPSMMEICCNGVEVLRLRNLLVRALIQREALLKIYASQMKSMSKDYKPNFKDYGFNFETF